MEALAAFHLEALPKEGRVDVEQAGENRVAAQKGETRLVLLLTSNVSPDSDPAALSVVDGKSISRRSLSVRRFN